MGWTEEQRKAIELRGKNIIVSAAAGSGKTSVLVERVKRLVIDEAVPVRRMLIVTFTNAAASEMRRKISRAIEDELSSAASSGDPAKRAYLLRQLDEIQRAHISTFHSFALDLIRRNFQLINVDPSFTVCDDAQADLLKADATEECFAEFFTAGGPEFYAMMDRFSTPKSSQTVKDIISQLYDTMMSMPEPEAWLRSEVEKLRNIDVLTKKYDKELRKLALEELSRAAKKLCRTREILLDAGVESLAEKLVPELDCLRELTELAESGRGLDELSDALSALEYTRMLPARSEKEAYEAVKNTVKELKDGEKSIINALKSEYLASSPEEAAREASETYDDLKVLSDMVLSFASRYRAAKDELRLLDFSDIEHYALEILKNDDVSASYRELFEHVFVDEYQDTNFIQDEIVKRVSRGNNCFLVGDLKQSIYHFRLAEPVIFKRHYEEYEGSAEAEAIDLNFNFRSSKAIVDSVNAICLPIIENYERNLLRHGREEKEGYEAPKSELYLLETEEDEIEYAPISELKNSEKEALLLAELVKKELRGGTRPQDIAVLMRSVRGSADILAKAFMDAGIPFFLNEAEGLLDTIEVEVFMNLLRVVDNRDQDVPLISALRSPCFGFGTEELCEIRLAKTEGSFFEALLAAADGPEGSPLSEKCRETLSRIDEFRRLSSELPLDEFCSILLEENAFIDYFGALPGGEQRRQNLRVIVERAAGFTGDNAGGLYAFIAYMDSLKKHNIKIPQIRLQSGQDSAVRIMTVHKSKGLEFPTVFVSGLGKRLNTREKNEAIVIHNTEGLALRTANAASRSYRKTLAQKLIKRTKLRETMEEETRILYVALTRARDKLVLTGHIKSFEKAEARLSAGPEGDIMSAGSFLELTAHAYLSSGAADFGKLHIVRASELAFEDASEERKGDSDIERRLEAEGSAEVDEDIYNEIERRFSYKYEPAGGDKKSKYSVTELNEMKREAEEPEIGPSFIMEKAAGKGLSAAHRGTAMHTALERLYEALKREEMNAAERGIEWYEDYIGCLREKGILSGEEAESIRPEALKGFAESELGRRMLASERVYREQPFSIFVDMPDEVFVQGIIDAFFVEDDGRAVLLDYKTNALRQGESREEFHERMRRTYELQLEIYKDAIEKIKGIRVKEAHLYLTSTGEDFKLSEY